MKTTSNYLNLKTSGILILILCVHSLILSGADLSGKKTGTNDSIPYLTYSGKITDSETKEPVAFANVYVEGSGIGTVSNLDGEFIIKVPPTMGEEILNISFVGYKTYEIPLGDLKNIKNSISIVPDPIPIQEVIIKTGDPLELLRKAIARINDNYPLNPEMLTAFYRETVKQNRHYVAVSEAVLDMYKSSYKNFFDADRLKIYKGRKSQDVKRMDTILFKLQGGPKTSLLLDVVKNPSTLLSEDFFKYYDYKLNGVINIDNRETFVIRFDQKNKVDLPLYQGNIYLDANNLAIARLDFRISDKAIDEADNELVRKKPFSMKVDVEDAKYLASYREINGKWHLNHVRAEAKFKCKWDKKLFRSVYTTMLEMAVTDRDTANISKFKYRESAKISDVFVDEVNYFLDEDYWGKYNVIKPDESIEMAIARLNRRFARNQ
jgi:hypothetical protein